MLKMTVLGSQGHTWTHVAPYSASGLPVMLMEYSHLGLFSVKVFWSVLQVGKVLRQVAGSHLDQQTGFIAFTLPTLHFCNLVV